MHLKLVIINVIFLASATLALQKQKFHTIENIQNEKEFKKILKSRNNVLVLFTSNLKENSNVLKVFRESSETVKGVGTMIVIDCSNNDLKKLCKKQKIIPDPFTLKHYKDSEYHKDYDRQLAVTSIVNFMRDPLGDIPFEEDSTATDVIHIPDANASIK